MASILAAARSIAGTAAHALLIYGIGYVVVGAIEYGVIGEITGLISAAASALAVFAIITD